MDLFIHKGDNFAETGTFDISIFQKRENKYMYIPAKSGYAKRTIKNFNLSELKRYARSGTTRSNIIFSKFGIDFLPD